MEAIGSVDRRAAASALAALGEGGAARDVVGDEKALGLWEGRRVLWPAWAGGKRTM